MAVDEKPVSEAYSQEYRREFFRLCLVPGVGPVLRERLLEYFGDPNQIFAAPPSELVGVAGVGPSVVKSITSAIGEIDVDAEFQLCREHGIDISLCIDSNYPKRLQEIPTPPGVLFIHGTLVPQDDLAIAIVGTRGCSNYGRRQARRFGRELSERGVTVVSGLARGIDESAHRAALEVGGRTIAVLGGGILRIYPPEHRPLAAQISQSGAVVSEYPPLRPSLRSTFPQRNRLISGLSWGVLVVEAPARSGSLVTARHATEQNREVMAIPGPVDRATFQGSHRLLKDGAQLIEHPAEVLESLGPLPAATEHTGRQVRHPAELNLSEQEQQVLDVIGSEPTRIDAIISSSDLPSNRVLSTLSILEVRQLVHRVSGQFVVRR